MVRIGQPEYRALVALLFRRYPHSEWATFARVAWRETKDGLVLVLVSLDAPQEHDLDERHGHVVINEPYSLRMALGAESHPFAVCVIHSHPRDYRPDPSVIDDDMDSYYADYLSGFAPGRPYVSLIVSEIGNEVAISGRVYWGGRWHSVNKVCVEHNPVVSWLRGGVVPHPPVDERRYARLEGAFGKQAAKRIRRSSVAVIGTGGTGSAAIEILARAGVGRLVIVDPDHIELSNLERMPGAWPEHAERHVSKVLVARDHVHRIDPEIEVEAWIGALPQQQIVDAVLAADVALGCTDRQHSRLALSDLAFRYLLPAIDCGVVLEGSEGHVTAQVLQLVRFLSTDPCALCRRMTDSWRLTQELMSPAERQTRQQAAENAKQRGELPDPYWVEEPQINTVGYLTSATAAIAAGYVVGWLSGRFDPPFERLQANFVAKYWDVTDSRVTANQNCACTRVRGWADQGTAEALITAPSHWPEAKVV